MKKIKSVLIIGLISAQVGAFMPHAWAEFESYVFYVSAQSGSAKPITKVVSAASACVAGVVLV